MDGSLFPSKVAMLEDLSLCSVHKFTWAYLIAESNTWCALMAGLSDHFTILLVPAYCKIHHFTLQKQKYIDFFQRKTDDSFLKCVLPTGVKDVLSNYHTTCFPSSEFLIPRLLNSKRSEARLGFLSHFQGHPMWIAHKLSLTQSVPRVYV